MNARRDPPARPVGLALALATALIALAAGTSLAAAKGPPGFHRGHLPAIGQIKLGKTRHGLAEITVPVTYTKAISSRGVGLESSEVTLRVGRRLLRGSALGETAVRTHRHHLAGTGTVVDRFVLGRKASRTLLGTGRKMRGRLVRVDVKHRIRERRGGKVMHEKDSSMTMAASHRARPQGESGQFTLRNDTSGRIYTQATPILCMYTDGEQGSNLQAFTSGEGRPIWPGGTIEARIEDDASLIDTAHYQGPRGESAGAYVDWLGLAAEGIANQLDIELTPFSLLIDMTTNCFGSASSFQLVAANKVLVGETEGGEQVYESTAASSEAWVLTSQECSHGCPTGNLITAFDALDYQGIGEEQVNPGIWSHESTKILEALAGGWRDPSVGAKMVQDNGLHWEWQRLEDVVVHGEEFGGGEEFEYDEKAWELSVHEGSSAAGFSG